MPVPFGRASFLASTLIREAEHAGLPAGSLTPVGGLRRFAPVLSRPRLLAVFDPPDVAGALDALSALPSVTSVLEKTTSRMRLDTARGALDVLVADPASAGAALVWHTGSRPHTTALVNRASQRHLVFADGELRRRGLLIDAPTEDALYRHLDLAAIPPELREGHDEIVAAEQGGLPVLIALEDMRGDLHMHTTWSDGRDSVSSMVLAARSLGYQYIAITDHSERAAAARTLAADSVARQRDEIDQVRESVSGIEVLHGVEVDIMLDGSLDFDDTLLERFDIVLASLHEHGGQSREELTRRYVTAIAHPLVNVITHLANRTPGFSVGYELDLDRIFDAAAAYGTALEIDGAPGHLDMDGVLARRAVAAGATVTIDSDCHQADALGRQMAYGVGTARRGWIEPRHVLNSRGIEAIRAFVARKRAGRQAGS